MEDITPQQCEAWLANPDVNPLTGRAIRPSGKVYKTLQAACASDRGDRKGKKKKETSAETDAAVPRHVTPHPPPRSPPIHRASIESKTSPSRATGSTYDEMISSYGLLQDARRKLRDGTPGLSSRLDQHFDVALASYASPLPMLRTVEEHLARIPSDGLLPYEEIDDSSVLRMLSITNCHDGQRKLTVALVEFIAGALLRFECDPKDILVVYAGASGLASAVASSMFPGVKMVLYDPAPNTLSHMPVSYKDKRIYRRSYVMTDDDPALNGWATQSLLIFTDKAGWFDDSVAQYCRDTILPRSGAKYMLFASDVRTTNNEKAIVRDMRDQMRWTMLTGCVAYMHKFRIPFHLDDGEAHRSAMEEQYNDFSHLPVGKFRVVDVDAARKRGKGDTLPYLDGKLHIELYGRQRTPELRLIGYASDAPNSDTDANNSGGGRKGGHRTKQGSGDNGDDPETFHIAKRYDIRPHEYRRIDDFMAVFNVVYRAHARYGYVSSHSPSDIHRIPRNYEIVAEHAIIHSCALALMPRPRPRPRHHQSSNGDRDRDIQHERTYQELAKRLHHNLRFMLRAFTPKDPLVCSLMSADNEFRKKMPNANVAVCAPHILDWARAIAEFRPDALIPDRFRTRGPRK